MADALVMGPQLDLAELVRMRHAYESARSAAGHGQTRGDVILRRDAYIAETTERALQDGLPALRYQFSNIYGTFDLNGTDRAFREFARDRFVLGDPADALDQILRYESELGVTEILFRVQLPGLHRDQVAQATRLLGEAVLPKAL